MTKQKPRKCPQCKSIMIPKLVRHQIYWTCPESKKALRAKLTR